MGIILGKEYYQRQNDNSPIVNLNFSVPSELESFFPLKDCLLDEKTIIPQKWLLLSNTKSIPASNNITWNCVKKLVSRKKKRIMIENYNFDMSYITQKTLLMSYPGIYLEGCYRNSRKDIIHYFNKFHKNSVKIYNLCSENYKQYNPHTFSKNNIKTAYYPVDDHNPASLKIIFDFCVDLTLFLCENENNVAAIHCKAGKGRSGLMITSYLIFAGLIDDCKEANSYYTSRRSFSGKGLTIASQRRYVNYFYKMLNENITSPYSKIIKDYSENRDLTFDKLYHKISLIPKFFVFGPFNSKKNGNLIIENEKNKFVEKVSLNNFDENNNCIIEMKNKIIFNEDIHFTYQFDNHTNLKFWINTAYIPKYILLLTKNEFKITPIEFDPNNFEIKNLKIDENNYSKQNDGVQENEDIYENSYCFKQKKIDFPEVCITYLRSIYNELRNINSDKKKFIVRIQLLKGDEFDGHKRLVKNKNLEIDKINACLVFYNENEIE